MKWKQVDPERGARRYVTRFAWLPYKIRNTVFWLEKYSVLQVYGVDTFNGYKWMDRPDLMEREIYG